MKCFAHNRRGEYQIQIEQVALDEARSGNDSRQQTYDALLSPHLARLQGWVRRRAPKGLDPEDIFQQTLVLALKNISSFRLEASVGTWLCTIALNVIRGRLRSWEYSRIVYCDSHQINPCKLQDPYPSPLDALEKKETSKLLHSQISKLPERYRLIVELLDLREFSTEEIMDTLSISRSAVKSRHYRARRMLLDLLTREQDMPDTPTRCLTKSPNDVCLDAEAKNVSGGIESNEQ